MAQFLVANVLTTSYMKFNITLVHQQVCRGKLSVTLHSHQNLICFDNEKSIWTKTTNSDTLIMCTSSFANFFTSLLGIYWTHFVLLLTDDVNTDSFAKLRTICWPFSKSLKESNVANCKSLQMKWVTIQLTSWPFVTLLLRTKINMCCHKPSCFVSDLLH